MAGPRTASSISRAAATPRRSGCRARPSPRSTPPPSASARCWRTSCSIRSPACPISTTRSQDREHALRLSARLHPERLARPAAPAIPKNIVMLTGRRLRRAAADRQADRRRGDVPLPVGLHRQGRRHREGREGSGGDLLDLLRRALHAAPPVGLRQPAARPHRASTTSIAGSSTPAGPAASTASAGACRSASRAACSRPRSTARSTGPISAATRISASRCRPRCRASSRTSSTRSRPGRTRPSLRRDRQAARRHVPRELQALREPCRR